MMGSSAGAAGEDLRKIKDEFKRFLTVPFPPRPPLLDDVKRILGNHLERRLIINYNDWLNSSPTMARGLLSDPLVYIEAFTEALKEESKRLEEESASEGKTARMTSSIMEAPRQQWFVGFTPNLGPAHHVSPRSLTTDFLRTLVVVEGIITKCSLVRPKVVRSVHYCPRTGEVLYRNYRDAATTTGIPTSAIYPTHDDNKNPLETEFGWSVYKDQQTVTIQEMPERAPPGQLPRSVDAMLDHDLVDRVKPGDRVRVVGVFRAVPLGSKLGNNVTKANFRTILVVNNVEIIGKESLDTFITEDDIRNIRAEARRSTGPGDDIFSRMAQSLAPSIFGHDYIKKALLLFLMGGNEKNLENGTHLRGDINLLLVGDPSTAKSQLLRFILHIAPLAISTSGRGSSGVGLTAAVTTDSETGERRLEAGAMVLADRGVVCIDEFDKMSEEDRVAIHEVMEQQSVTIAKAGIHTSLNARCSVLAAANPAYGQYNRHKKPSENIRLPDSLLSRFDLLFIVLDELNPAHDRSITEHVLRSHMYRPPGELEGTPLDMSDGHHGGCNIADALYHLNSIITTPPKHIDLMSELSAHREDVVETPMFQKHNPLHRRKKEGGEEKRQLYTMEFIKKYIIYAKNRFQPQLMDDAEDYIAEEYTKLRGKMDVRTQPVTARTLETLIRLSAAHAKCRLSHEVTREDAEAAVALVNYALYHEAQPRAKQAAAKGQGQTAGGQEDEDQHSTKAVAPNKRPAPSADGNGNGNARPTRAVRQQPPAAAQNGAGKATTANAKGRGKGKGKEKMDVEEEEDDDGLDAMDEEQMEVDGDGMVEAEHDDDDDGEDDDADVAEVTEERVRAVKQALFQLRTERSSNALSIDDLEQKLKKMNAKVNHATVEAILLEKLEDTICYLKEAGQIFHLA